MKLSFIAALIASSICGIASADNVYSENFNAPGFKGDVIQQPESSDNWSVTKYFVANQQNGWTFAPGTYYATDSGNDGALQLNEGSGNGIAATTVSGLTAGAAYVLVFNAWGDNGSGQDYGLNVSIDGSSKLTFSGTAKTSNHYQGTGGNLLSIGFTATGVTADLIFAQTSNSAASPIIDNITISAVPEPESYALLLAGLGLVGGIARRRNRKTT